MTTWAYIDFLRQRKKNSKNLHSRFWEDIGDHDVAHLFMTQNKLTGKNEFTLEEGFNHILFREKSKHKGVQDVVLRIAEKVRQSPGDSIEEKIRYFLNADDTSGDDFEDFTQRFILLYYAKLSDSEAQFLRENNHLYRQ